MEAEKKKSTPKPKVIRFDKRNCIVREKYNNFHFIFIKLAVAEKKVILKSIPKKKELRSHFIGKYDKNKHICEFSNKDFKRLENPRKYELPINAVDILEVVVEDIIAYKHNMNYKCNDNDILSVHMIKNSIELLNVLVAYINDPDYSNAKSNKYKASAEYVQKRLKDFDEKYNYSINTLLNREEK